MTVLSFAANEQLQFLIMWDNNRQWSTVVYQVLGTQKCFDTRKEDLETQSEAECF